MNFYDCKIKKAGKIVNKYVSNSFEIIKESIVDVDAVDALLSTRGAFVIEFFNGSKDYLCDGKQIYCNSTEEFIRLLKLKAFW